LTFLGIKNTSQVDTFSFPSGMLSMKYYYNE